MSFEWALYVFATLGAGLLTIGVGVYSWRQRSAPGAKMIAVISFSGAWWAFCNVFQVMATDLAAMLFWDNMKIIGIVPIPVAWIALSLEYSGYGRFVTRRFWVLVSLEPCVAVVMALTDPIHELIHESPRIDTSGPFPYLGYELGVGLVVDLAYGYFLLSLGAALIAWKLLHMSRFYYPQTAAILAAMILPTISHVIWVAGLPSPPVLDITPIFFSVSSILFAWAVLRQGLLGIVPLALDSAVRSMNDGVIVLDEEDRVVHLNPAMEQMVGQRTIDVRGFATDQLLSGWSELRSIALSREYGKREIALGEDPGHPHYEVHIAPLRDGGGNLVGTLFVLHDITDIRHAQDELQQHAIELRARNEDLAAYAHTVAHGLKNVLHLMMGHCGLLLMSHSEMSPEKIQTTVEQVDLAAQKMNDIIESLMLLSGIRRETLTLEPLDMVPIMNEVTKRLRAMIEEYHADIILPEAWPTAVGYAPWIEEVWDNYISNAIKYGGSPPRVHLGGEETEDGMVRFWVRDNGTGIPEEKRPLIFSSFGSVEYNGAKGHGLGLSIVERIVKKLGGTATLEESSNSGSTFTFTLPSIDRSEE
jgi:PAS domain S-box-containing protein